MSDSGSYGPEDFARFLAKGPERKPWLYAAKRTESPAFRLDVERPEKVTPPPNPENVSGLAVGVEASANPKAGVEAKKPVFDALERAAGAEVEEMVFDAQEEPPQEEDPNG